MSDAKVINKALNSIVNDANSNGESMSKDAKSVLQAFGTEMQKAMPTDQQVKGVKVACAQTTNLIMDGHKVVAGARAEKIKTAELGAAAAPAPDTPQAD